MLGDSYMNDNSDVVNIVIINMAKTYCSVDSKMRSILIYALDYL